ncbi:MAG: endolytic transglycosylase MltG [Actinomycetes bacterium]
MTSQSSETVNLGPIQRQRRRSRVALGLGLIVVLGVVIAAGVGLWNTFGPPKDYSGPGFGQVDVIIPSGASAKRIGTILNQADVVASQRAFVSAAKANAESRSIGPGTYSMLKQMKAQDAVARLLSPSSRVTARVIVREGASLREIKNQIITKTKISAADVDQVLANPQALGLPVYAQNKAEGFLFPATYDVEPTDTATTLLQAMVSKFNEVSAQIGFERKAAAAGISPKDAVTIASLVQAEVSPADYSKVSRVILNRVSKGMRLQFDSTVVYALGGVTSRLTSKDLQVDSPYNMYRNDGLPPGPINSPSELALEAAVAPATGPWIYFVTTDTTTGLTKFTDSYAEFLKFKAEYKGNLR